MGSLRASEFGPAIPLRAGGEPWVITKLRVTDCRATRGFVGAPVDGTTKSGSWDGKLWEYHMPDCGTGVEYSYMHGDGLHITFADNAGFNAVLVRGGIKARLLRDVQKYDQPSTGQLVCEFPGQATTSRAWFDSPVKTNKVSFFDVGDGLIADVSFFRVRRVAEELNASAEPLPTAEPKTNDKSLALTSAPFAQETSLAAIGVEFDLDENPSGTNLTISVLDPLNPRLELHGADYVVSGNGHVRIVCNFADQVIPVGTTLSLSITSDRLARINHLTLQQYRIPKERAIVEALEHRKFLLHALYTPVCEARPWNAWNFPGDDAKYFSAPPNPDPTQERLRFWVHEIVATLQQCRDLDPQGKDPIVRQYYQWIYRKILKKSPGGTPAFDVHYDHVEGVPEWASLVHQAWMQARQVPQWWIDHRMTPDGEFGGLVGDDTDMYGNYAPFPMLERDGVGGKVLDAAARIAELAEKENLEQGVNKVSMDPLHAYEEGMNLESELAYWNYGDPVYLERCMNAARSTERMTVLTDKGHRHFRNNDEGVKDIATPGPLEGEHGTHCLMWHPTFVVAWYNHNPLAIKWLSEWADGWLDHMKPGDYGAAVKLPEDVTTKTDPIPFTGGWGMTGSTFMFLSDITGDPRFIRPYLEYFNTTGKNTGIHLAEILQMGMLPDPEKTVATVKGTTDAVLYATPNDGPWNAPLYAAGDIQPFINALKKDIEELQRFPYMYTQVECFTDRVFLYPIINPSIAYTGGYTTRNKLNLTYAITWNGFGTDYAALVTSATGQHLKVLLCNLSDKPITGSGRLWRLEQGKYELNFGPEKSESARKETINVIKGTDVTITLPSKTVQVLELKQLRKTQAMYDRADLALSARELKLEGGKLTGVAHNIGSKGVEDVVIALVNKDGEAIQTKHLGRLDAPVDLIPKRVAFEFDALPADARGASVVLDPEQSVPEIFKGNNRAALSN